MRACNSQPEKSLTMLFAKIGNILSQSQTQGMNCFSGFGRAHIGGLIGKVVFSAKNTCLYQTIEVVR